MQRLRLRRLQNLAVRKLGAGFERLSFLQLGALGKLRPVRFGRGVLAQKYLRGSGIEIGAMASPSFRPLGASIKYVDLDFELAWKKAERDEEHRDEIIIEPDIVDDAQFLKKIGDDQLDFVVAYHVLEHVPRTLEAIGNWIRVVRSGGHILMAVPDMRFTRDRHRQLTTTEHFLHDYEEGPECSEAEHFRDIAINVYELTTEEEIEEYRRRTPTPHYHVWDLWSFIRFLELVHQVFAEKVELLEVGLNHEEDICALRVR